jgi:hypothetical protein
MPAAFISPIIIERGFTWEINFDVKLSNGSTRNLSGFTSYLTASGMYLTGAVNSAIGRVTFGLTTAQTTGFTFDRIGYEVRLISGVTAERMACGELVLSTGTL